MKCLRMSRPSEMADNFIEQYVNGELDYLGIVYTRFYSVASQHAQTLTVMPITELIDDLTTRSTVISPSEMAVENIVYVAVGK